MVVAVTMVMAGSPDGGEIGTIIQMGAMRAVGTIAGSIGRRREDGVVAGVADKTQPEDFLA